jgi:hypothetical protein
VFIKPSLEWVALSDAFRLARTGGFRNKLEPLYAELDNGDTQTWFVDFGVENVSDMQNLPSDINWNPALAGSLSRLDASAATRPVILSNRGYFHMGVAGTQRWLNNNADPTLDLENLGSGPSLRVRDGIDFSLDDTKRYTYDTGTFTPTIAGDGSAGTGTYTRQAGVWTRNGNVITVTISLAWTAHTGTGNILVTGLPLASRNDSALRSAFSTFGSNISLTAANVMQAYMFSNDTRIFIYQVASGGGASTQVPMDAAGEIVITGSYHI